MRLLISNFVLEKLRLMRHNDVLCDLEILSGDGIKMCVHSCVWVAAFEDSRTIRSSRYKGAGNGVSKIELSDITGELLSSIIDFIYGESIHSIPIGFDGALKQLGFTDLKQYLDTGLPEYNNSGSCESMKIKSEPCDTDTIMNEVDMKSKESLSHEDHIHENDKECADLHKIKIYSNTDENHTTTVRVEVSESPVNDINKTGLLSPTENDTNTLPPENYFNRAHDHDNSENEINNMIDTCHVLEKEEFLTQDLSNNPNQGIKELSVINTQRKMPVLQKPKAQMLLPKFKSNEGNVVTVATFLSFSEIQKKGQKWKVQDNLVPIPMSDSSNKTFNKLPIFPKHRENKDITAFKKRRGRPHKVISSVENTKSSQDKVSEMSDTSKEMIVSSSTNSITSACLSVTKSTGSSNPKMDMGPSVTENSTIPTTQLVTTVISKTQSVSDLISQRCFGSKINGQENLIKQTVVSPITDRSSIQNFTFVSSAPPSLMVTCSTASTGTTSSCTNILPNIPVIIPCVDFNTPVQIPQIISQLPPTMQLGQTIPQKQPCIDSVCRQMNSAPRPPHIYPYINQQQPVFVQQNHNLIINANALNNVQKSFQPIQQKSFQVNADNAKGKNLFHQSPKNIKRLTKSRSASSVIGSSSKSQCSPNVPQYRQIKPKFKRIESSNDIAVSKPVTECLTKSSHIENLTKPSSNENLMTPSPIENLTKPSPVENWTKTPQDEIVTTSQVENLAKTPQSENLTETSPVENLTKTSPNENLTKTRKIRRRHKTVHLDTVIIGESLDKFLSDNKINVKKTTPPSTKIRMNIMKRQRIAARRKSQQLNASDIVDSQK